jgi:hypothetical protein
MTKKAMEDVRRDEVKPYLENKADSQINLNRIADKVEEYINKMDGNTTVSERGELARLKDEVAELRRQGTKAIPDAELLKQNINAVVNTW